MSRPTRSTIAERTDAIAQRLSGASDEVLTDRRFVEPDEFHRLAISPRYLLRWDDGAAGLRGLWDPIDGIWFVTNEDKLLRSSEGRRRAAAPLSA